MRKPETASAPRTMTFEIVFVATRGFVAGGGAGLRSIVDSSVMAPAFGSPPADRRSPLCPEGEVERGVYTWRRLGRPAAAD